MSRIQMLVSSLILGASIIGCAAEPTAKPTPPATDDTTADPSTPSAPTPADPATPTDPTTPTETTPPEPQLTKPAASPACTAGGLFCCNAVASANTPLVASLLALLGVHVDALTEAVGVTCQNVATVDACSNVPACCTSNLLNLVALDCSTP
jgi:hypothetical protein